ncbi:Protein RarD [Lentibacillus sp. JNUCC-1]|uniref:EamA family transporter RarD n=1 Tax=Lentibacillus sp. JNUCC-1 TaxID=2654513 RepID=UPI0012E9929E|nr:EamA family transporter RarD [Lentibacillus sp. JNUCC-1]MUV37478.1 Protein RarD [Lentibacillus sp. JNUCC-1]
MEQDEKFGILYTAGAYFLWGLLPIYWKLVDEVPAGQILAHRIVWSFVFVSVLVLITKKGRPFLHAFKALFQTKKQAVQLLAASLVITLNWLTFIWAVNSGHVVQASLGYYINPLVSIVLGIVFLKEGISRRLIVSFILASLGVLYLTFSYGVFPWVSIVLALSFAFYGLIKKTISIGPMFGLTIETMFVTPIALIYLSAVSNPALTLESAITPTGLLLMGAGAATAVPLLLFAAGAQKIPLSMVGFLQYIAPTLMLILGVFVYNEVFTSAHFIAFVLIWSALFIYMSSWFKRASRKDRQAEH